MTAEHPRSSDIDRLRELAPQLAQGEPPEGWEFVSSSVNARVAHCRQKNIYFKLFLPRGALEKIKALLRGSRATRARLRNDELRANGFGAPENIAWGSLPGGLEYLYSSGVPGHSITSWLRERLQQRQGKTLQQRRLLLDALGHFIGHLHASGFVHGDLRTSNVLAELEGQQFTFSLIDNERTFRSQPPPGRAIERNLMQLNMLLPSDLTHTDRTRFFRAWRREMSELSPVEHKVLARQSYNWAARRLTAKGLL